MADANSSTGRKRTTEKHGMTRTPEYHAWSAMRRRCNSPSCGFYYLYGARGITICPEWISFTQFLADMGKRPSAKHSLGRIDNELGYFPGNCRWETRDQQNKNTRRTRMISHNGKSQCLKDWAREYGIDNNTLKHRLKQGLTMEVALAASAYSKHPLHRLVTYLGKTQTVTEWAKEYRIKFQTLFNRLNAGWTIEESISASRYGINHRGTPITHLGKTQTVAAWSREVGISITTLHNRLSKGWSVQDALTKPPHKKGFHIKTNSTYG